MPRTQFQTCVAQSLHVRRNSAARQFPRHQALGVVPNPRPSWPGISLETTLPGRHAGADMACVAQPRYRRREPPGGRGDTCFQSSSPISECFLGSRIGSSSWCRVPATNCNPAPRPSLCQFCSSTRTWPSSSCRLSAILNISTQHERQFRSIGIILTIWD